MVVAEPITAAAIEAIAAAVFAPPDPFVVEAYSEPDHEPVRFATQRHLVAYISAQASQPRGLAYVFVVYPDMVGLPVRETIHLDPKHYPGHRLRYTWQGWGLISVQIYGAEQARRSSISANSAARAKAWASTYPGWSAPDQWNWKAVESHTRRLQRILTKVT